MKLLQVMLECLRMSSPDDKPLSNRNLWSLLTYCFEANLEDRFSDLLKKMAQNTLMQVTLLIFSRAVDCDDDAEENNESSLSNNRRGSSAKGFHALSQSGNGSKEAELDDKPYNTLCLRKFFLYLANTLISWTEEDPFWTHKRGLGLYLLNTALETGGFWISDCEDLVSVLEDDICKYLLVNLQNNDHFILSLTYRVVFNLFLSVKRHMKVQLEVFFTSIHLKLNEKPENYQQSIIGMESILDYCREPTLILEFYTNYDCDVHCANLYEQLCKFLVKNAYPTDGSISSVNAVALKSLVEVIKGLALRCRVETVEENEADGPGSDSSSSVKSLPHEVSESRQTTAPSVGEDSLDVIDENEKGPTLHSENSFKEQRSLKKKVLRSAEIFNNEKKFGITKLQQEGFLPEELDEVSMASFLRNNPALDREVLGAYLGDKHDFNIKVLTEYAKLFEFESMDIEEALRAFLSSFLLPGEAWQINRIVEAFAEVYYEANKDNVLANSTVAYVLSYSIILLNTDQHNPEVPRRMTLEDFLRNNREINDGKNVPRDLLEKIYYSIKTNQIQVYETAH
eukprot:CAMPEP_0115010016 /NCGR_PEP_ID=MMETSP0216-20121206/23024_1 /TAXON_ID=223996 /ORGANISM="Protocruzia adherens, Strain Boccale" /LENGTH=567 /DNA_ID=CAMNT_0002378069 /DNA_START=397 /DNA_END=2097 /DNA_ORIENTATION=+